MHLYTFYCWNIKEHIDNQTKVTCGSCRKSTQLTQFSPTISNIDANLSHWLFSSIIYSENVTNVWKYLATFFEAGLAYQLER